MTKMRMLDQCPNCASYEANWTEDIVEEMNEVAPGEVCSQCLDVWKTDKCPGWVGCDET